MNGVLEKNIAAIVLAYNMDAAVRALNISTSVCKMVAIVALHPPMALRMVFQKDIDVGAAVVLAYDGDAAARACSSSASSVEMVAVVTMALCGRCGAGLQ